MATATAEKKKTKTVHIGKMIRQHLEEVGMTKSEFARRIGTSPQNIYGIFKRGSCDTELLRQVSVVLNFDFFLYYSTSAVTDGQTTKTALQLQQEITELRARCERAERQVELLEEIRRLSKKN